MKKIGYYLVPGFDTEFAGVDRKINDQLRVFNEKLKCERIVIQKLHKNIFMKVLTYLPFGSFYRDYSESLDRIAPEADFVYIRYAHFDRKYLCFLRDLKVRCPGTKIILEIPTYPYRNQLLNIREFYAFYFKDLIYRGKVRNYVDRIATFSSDKEIYGIKTIRIINGIIVDDVVLKERVENDDTFTLLAVAQFQRYHGYERIIKSISDYIKHGGTRKIRFYLIGYGPETEYYKSLVSEYGLTGIVEMPGIKRGKELDDYYRIADIGVGCFGLYKSGLERNSTIKSAEYLANGLPVIFAGVEDAFEGEQTDYCCRFSNEASDVDFEKILMFYDNLVRGKDKNLLRSMIRSYAKKTVDMEVAMKAVIDYIS